MTDTRKYIDEQFDKFFEFDTDDKSTVTSTSCKLFAEHLIADLLAVIELHRQAFQWISENDDSAYYVCEKKAIEALAITPKSVELVEVGELNVVGNEVGTGCIPYIQITNHSSLGKLYTIKQKG